MRHLVLLLASMTLASSAVADRSELSVIGWNAEETAFAARLYNHASEDMDTGEPPLECKGYINHRGKKFRGSLALVVYEVGEKPRVFPVQDWFATPEQPCTPGKIAKARLEEAKAYLAKIGVTRDKLGKTFDVTKKWSVPVAISGKKLGRLEMQEKVSEKVVDDASAIYERKGKRAFLFHNTQGDTEVIQMFRRPWKRKYSAIMAGSLSVKSNHVFGSPTGRTIVVFEEVSESNMRGGSSKIELVLVGYWDGTKLAAW